MRCNEVDRWLNSGLLEGASAAAARRHARSCLRCGASIRAAEAIETALRRDPPATPAAFSERVLARARATDQIEAQPEATRAGRAWLRVLEEPEAAVALALSPVAFVLALAWPDTLAKIFAMGQSALGVWLLAAPGATESFGPITATARLALGVTVVGGIAAVGWALPAWVASAFAPSGRRPRSTRPPKTR